MSKKARTLTDLSEELDSEFTWRFSEIRAMKQCVKSVLTPSQTSAIIRAGVALLYAHFEGFVKESGGIYLQHISMQRLKNGNLKTNFLINSINNSIKKDGVDSIYKTRDLTQLLESLFEKYNDRSNIQYKNSVNTKSNLWFNVLEDIFSNLHLPIRNIRLRKAKINELVDSRNSIAHGKYLEIDKEYYIELVDIILDTMKLIKGQIETSASNQDYINRETIFAE